MELHVWTCQDFIENLYCFYYDRKLKSSLKPVILRENNKNIATKYFLRGFSVKRGEKENEMPIALVAYVCAKGGKVISPRQNA